MKQHAVEFPTFQQISTRPPYSVSSRGGKSVLTKKKA
jgi:hypothetical protein